MFDFINEYMPWVLLLLLLPPLILLIRRRRVVLQWAAFDWMKRALQKRRKVSRVEQLLKLISKLCLLLALALALSRPAWRSEATAYLVIVDVSPSMGTVFGDADRLAAAVIAASDLTDEIGGDFGIASFDGELAILAGRGVAMNPQQILSELELSPRAGSFSGLVDSLRSSGAVDHYDAFIFISDFQQQRYGDSEIIAREANRLGDTARLFFVPVDPRSGLVNVGIESVALSPEGFFAATENRIEVSVRNFSSVPVEFLPVTLHIDGQAYDRAMISLPAYGRGSVSLSLRGESVESSERGDAVVAIPEDDYPLDDRHFMVLRAPGPLRVLIARPAKGERPFDLDVFLQAAFAAIDDPVVEVVSPHQLALSRLDEYDLIVTLGMSFPADAAVTRAILDALETGVAWLGFSDLEVIDPWHGLSIGIGDESQEQNHPDINRGELFSFMKETDIDPGSIAFFRYAPFDIDNAEVQAGGMLYLQNDEAPITVMLQRGDGYAMLSNWLPYIGYTSIFYNPNFVQVMMRMLAFALNRDPLMMRSPEQLDAMVLEERDLSASYSLAVEDGRRYPLSVERLDDRLSASAEAMIKSGICEVLKGDEVIDRFGYNLGCEDSAVEPVAVSVFDPLVESDTIRVLAPGDAGTISALREFSLGFLILLLLAAIFEYYAHFLRGRSQRE